MGNKANTRFIADPGDCGLGAALPACEIHSRPFVHPHSKKLGSARSPTENINPVLIAEQHIENIIKGWRQQGLLHEGVLPEGISFRTSNIQKWFHSLSQTDSSQQAAIDPQLLIEDRICKSIADWQAYGLLPKHPTIRHNNVQEWLHLFVPIHTLIPVCLPPYIGDSWYWVIHRQRAISHWKFHGITSEESLKIPQLVQTRSDLGVRCTCFSVPQLAAEPTFATSPLGVLQFVPSDPAAVASPQQFYWNLEVYLAEIRSTPGFEKAADVVEKQFEGFLACPRARQPIERTAKEESKGTVSQFSEYRAGLGLVTPPKQDDPVASLPRHIGKSGVTSKSSCKAKKPRLSAKRKVDAEDKTYTQTPVKRSSVVAMVQTRARIRQADGQPASTPGYGTDKHPLDDYLSDEESNESTIDPAEPEAQKHALEEQDDPHAATQLPRQRARQPSIHPQDSSSQMTLSPVSVPPSSMPRFYQPQSMKSSFPYGLFPQASVPYACQPQATSTDITASSTSLIGPSTCINDSLTGTTASETIAPAYSAPTPQSRHNANMPSFDERKATFGHGYIPPSQSLPNLASGILGHGDLHSDMMAYPSAANGLMSHPNPSRPGDLPYVSPYLRNDGQPGSPHFNKAPKSTVRNVKKAIRERKASDTATKGTKPRASTSKTSESPDADLAQAGFAPIGIQPGATHTTGFGDPAHRFQHDNLGVFRPPPFPSQSAAFGAGQYGPRVTGTPDTSINTPGVTATSNPGPSTCLTTPGLTFHGRPRLGPPPMHHAYGVSTVAGLPGCSQPNACLSFVRASGPSYQQVHLHNRNLISQFAPGSAEYDYLMKREQDTIGRHGEHYSGSGPQHSILWRPQGNAFGRDGPSDGRQSNMGQDNYPGNDSDQHGLKEESRDSQLSSFELDGAAVAQPSNGPMQQPTGDIPQTNYMRQPQPSSESIWVPDHPQSPIILRDGKEFTASKHRAAILSGVAASMGHAGNPEYAKTQDQSQLNEQQLYERSQAQLKMWQVNCAGELARHGVQAAFIIARKILIIINGSHAEKLARHVATWKQGWFGAHAWIDENAVIYDTSSMRLIDMQAIYEQHLQRAQVHDDHDQQNSVSVGADEADQYIDPSLIDPRLVDSSSYGFFGSGQ
ncbi:hypothetical protein BJ170DRAFT_714758 [Xylariales sp. AK1849]|nr:hypothetical protein BJ170DRAFT_714758 [Xylariales sp. AK1849]